MIKSTNWRGQNRSLAVRSAVHTVDISPYAVINFPSNPAIGDQFLAPNGSTYEWDGEVWTGINDPTSNIVAIFIGADPPPNPVAGNLWWRNDPDGNLYIFYVDTTSSQWVPAMQPPPAPPPGFPDAPSDGLMYARMDGAWVAIP